MKCPVQGCPGEMEERRIVHTFVRDGKPLVVEDLPALVCPVCGYTVLDLQILDELFALDPATETPVGHAPVFRLSPASAQAA
jgi:YgiT-type zinc finger domain-containing protein